MKPAQLSLGIGGGLNDRVPLTIARATAVDLFAGLGGFSAAARKVGLRVLWAANHWPEAVAIHKANHPDTAHAVQDLQQMNFHLLPDFDVMLASPSCAGHTKARGADKPEHDIYRSTAWAVVTCAEAKRPRVVVVENVVEFLQWALYPAWAMAMQALGYALSVNVIDAAHCQVPQNRVRVFIVATLSKAPIVIRRPAMDHVAASSFIRWDEGTWANIDGAGYKDKTMVRIQDGWRRFGDRFVHAYYGSNKIARSIERPIGTITTVSRWGVVDGGRHRMLMPEEARAAMDFPDDYVLPLNTADALKMLGNAVCVGPAAHVISEVLRAA